VTDRYEVNQPDGTPAPRVASPTGEVETRKPAKRPLRSRLIELGLWALLSIITAVVMVLLSDTLLPANF
jgi:hypothetical protein